MRIAPYVLVLATLSTHALADDQHQHGGAPPEKLGTVHFTVSCSEPAQKEFTRGIALLHSFWYSEAARGFANSLAADPACGMAAWGMAMSDYHPIWAPPTPPELSRGAASAKRAAALSAKTERERDFIAAIGVFYRDADTLDHRTRAVAYEKAMEALAKKHAADDEAQIFYALALDGTQLPNDKTYANYRKAAEILERVLPRQPEHPGVAHYIIHSYDVPPLAKLGLPAARRYAKIAPSAAHALHMPSHIFTRLGLWDDSIASNLDSARVAKEFVTREKPGAASFDELHALDYLAYAYLQKADDASAEKVLGQIQAVSSLDDPQFAAAYALAAVPARWTLERRAYKDAAALTVRPASFPWAKYRWAEALTHHARAMGAARTGDVAAARSATQQLAAIRDDLKAAKVPYWPDQVEAQRLSAEGWIARAEGKDDAALASLRAAADLEDSSEKHPVTPGAVLPAREQLGDLLLELKKPAEALAAYESSNERAPNRLNGLLGAAKAARQSGDEAKARDLAKKLAELTGERASSRPGLKAEMAQLQASR